MTFSFNDIDPFNNKLMNNGHYRVVNLNVFDYCWEVLDLFEEDDTKKKFSNFFVCSPNYLFNVKNNIFDHNFLKNRYRITIIIDNYFLKIILNIPTKKNNDFRKTQ